MAKLSMKKFGTPRGAWFGIGKPKEGLLGVGVAVEDRGGDGVELWLEEDECEREPVCEECDPADLWDEDPGFDPPLR